MKFKLFKLGAWESMKMQEKVSEFRNKNQELSLTMDLAPQQIRDVRIKYKFKTYMISLKDQPRSSWRNVMISLSIVVVSLAQRSTKIMSQ